MKIQSILNIITTLMVIKNLFFLIQFKYSKNNEVNFEQNSYRLKNSIFNTAVNKYLILFIYSLFVVYALVRMLVLKKMDISFFENLYAINLIPIFLYDYYKSFLIKTSPKGLYLIDKFIEWDKIKSYTLEENTLVLNTYNSKRIKIIINPDKEKDMESILKKYLS